MKTNKGQLDVTRLNILDYLNAAVLLIDHEQNVQYMNSAAEDFFGVSSNQASQFNLDSIQVNGTRRFSDLLSQHAENDSTYTYRGLEMVFNGSSHHADCSIKPLEQYMLVEVITIDRIMRIAREEDLIQQHLTAREIARGLAHEINNPLGGIRGAAQLLQKEASDDSLSDFTTIIINESDRLQNLMKRMLGPNTKPTIQTLNIHEVLQHVVKLLQAEFESQLHFILDYDPSIPELAADREQLIQAILNIVRNAIQATEAKGTITLRTRPICSYTIGNTFNKLVLKIDIIDDGPGIPAEIMERIFYPMVTSRSEGTGLGLSIAQSIISLHKGLIECHSQPQQNTFHHPAPYGGPLMNANVWIIDDDQSIRWVLERALSQADLSVTSFASANAAMDSLQTTNEPDVIITDIRMPGMTGFDFMHEFKQEKPNIPVIIMTAHSDLDSAVSAYEGGAFEYLPKPFDIDEAVELTKRACVARKESKQQAYDNHQETPEIIGEAASMQEVFRAIGRLSQSNINVLINGESGTR